MYHHKLIRFSVLPLALCAIVTVADAQGRGQAQGADKAKEGRGRGEQPAARGADRERPQQARNEAQGNRGRSDAAQDTRANRGRSDAQGNRDDNRDNRVNRDDNRGNRDARDNRGATAPNPSARAIERASDNARFKRTWSTGDIRPDLRRRMTSDRWAERVAAGALAHGFARKVGDNAFVITPSGKKILVRNRKGDVLVELDEDRARNLGGWKVKPVDDRVGEGAPSFCRSGEGHPNWGRQWCLDKGFGLGVDNRRDGVRWGRNLDANDVVFVREPTSTTLTRAALEAVLGQRAVDRLALHAITLGLVDPLVGTWRTDPAGPRVLLVSSGDSPVAEIVHTDRDLRSDRMVVALRPWDL